MDETDKLVKYSLKKEKTIKRFYVTQAEMYIFLGKSIKKIAY